MNNLSENMQKMKEILATTFRNVELWNYYGGNISVDIFTPEGCEDFVRNFFAVSGKAKLPICLLSSDKNLPAERWQHIVYVFLLGVYVYKNSKYKSTIDTEIERLNNRDKLQIKFEFVWFLICLSHDLFHSSESDLSKDNFLDFAKYKLRKRIGVPRLFDKLPLRYYFYRRLQGKNDHGVVAGFRMYRELCKIRKEQEKNSNEGNQDVILDWNKNLEKIYNYAAWIVACHNMWFMHSYEPEETLSCWLYRLFGLDALIFNSQQDVTKYKEECEKFPIFQLFCIIDTIEVIKVVCNTEELDYIKMEASEDKIVVDVSASKDKDRLKYKIESLNKWIVNVESPNKYLFTIKTKQQ